MKVHKTARYAALLAIVLFWVLITAAMIQTNFGPFSQQPLSYLGVSSATALFREAITGSALLLLVFGLYLRAFEPRRLFWWLYLIALPLQITVAFFPYQHNNQPGLLHWGAGGLVAVIIIGLPWVFAGSKYITRRLASYSRRYTMVYFVAIPIEVLLLVFFKQYALSEILNLLIFDGWLILIFLTPVYFEIINKA